MREGLFMTKITKILIVLIVLVSLAISRVGEAVFATNFVTGGGGAPGGSGSGSSLVSYNCYKVASCPRWILVRQEDYQAILAAGNSRIAPNKGAYPNIDNVCKNDKRVVIAGNLRLNRYNPVGYNAENLIIYNMTSGSVSPQKSDRRFTSYVNGSGKVISVDGKNSGDNFMNWPVNGVNGITYGGMLDKIIKDNNVKEKEIAVFCESMIQVNYKLTAYAIDESGNLLNNGTAFYEVSGSAGKTVEVSPISLGGYTFTGQWKYYDNKANTRSAQKFSEKLAGNRKIYAVYRKSVPSECDPWTPQSYLKSYLNNSNGSGQGTTSVVSKVKNKTLNQDYKDATFAKPTDKIDWIHCYYPGAQIVYSALGNNAPKDWGNAFTVTSDNLRNPNENTTAGTFRSGTLNPAIYNGGQYPLGSSDAKSLLDNNYEVSTKRVGKNEVLKETNRASIPKSVTVKGRTMSNYDSTSATTAATVSVPYNFINTATIELGGIGGVVYAGETATISSAKVQIRARKNETLGGTYATRVDGAKVKYVTYLSGSKDEATAKTDVSSSNICEVLNKMNCIEQSFGNEITMNSEGESGMNAEANAVIVEDSLNDKMMNASTLKVHDTIAGNYFCVVAAVYPYTSGNDLNMEPSGSNTWYVSAPSCAPVAKRPSLQVWGSGVYTAGNISMPVATKRVVDGFIGFDATKDPVTFGSWVETGIVAKGQVIGLASGAATGFAGNTTRTMTENGKSLGGSKNFATTGICVLGPLTIPNLNCIAGDAFIGTSTNITGGLSMKPEDKDALITRFVTEDGTFQYHNEYATLGAFIDGVLGGNNIIPAGQNQTYIVDASGKDFIIDRNIQYQDTNYEELTTIPKLIIRANKIKIGCDTTRIDAVLIADGEVNTCSGVNNVNDPRRSNQLKINGTIIAGSLNAGRTYGASIGAYSVIPAEIIDYDTSLYLWSLPRPNTSNSNKLNTVYMRELAPRY